MRVSEGAHAYVILGYNLREDKYLKITCITRYSNLIYSIFFPLSLYLSTLIDR